MVLGNGLTWVPALASTQSSTSPTCLVWLQSCGMSATQVSVTRCWHSIYVIAAAQAHCSSGILLVQALWMLSQRQLCTGVRRSKMAFQAL